MENSTQMSVSMLLSVTQAERGARLLYCLELLKVRATAD
jgi:hypothetical protein